MLKNIAVVLFNNIVNVTVVGSLIYWGFWCAHHFAV